MKITKRQLVKLIREFRLDDDVPRSGSLPPDIFDDIYLKRYATALIKRQWGANLSKFEGVQMLGGVTLNGAKIFEEAQADQKN